MQLPVLPARRMALNLRIVLSAAVLTVGLGLDDSELKRAPSNRSTPQAPRQGGKRLYKELLKKLFPDDHDNAIPPNGRYPVDITIDLVIDSLTDLDLKSQTFTVSVWFQVTWQDEYLAWDVDEYPIETLTVEETRVWRPALAVYNSLVSRDQLMKVELPLLLKPDGQVKWYPGDTLSLNCPVRLWDYPFDSQTCTIRIVQWGNGGDQVNCSEATVKSEVPGNGEWDITSMTWDRLEFELDVGFYWEITYSITMKRKWIFYAINIVFPIVLVSGLNCLVFMLPVQGSEKMSVSVTNFLTLGVFLAMIQDSLPTNSDTICFLSMYLAMQLTLGALAVVLSTLQVSHYHKIDRSAANLSPDGQSLEDIHRAPPKEGSSSFDEKETEIGNECLASDTGNNYFASDLQRQSARSSQRHRKVWGLSWKPHVPRAFKRHKSLLNAKMDLSAKVDAICFPIFLALNVLSFLTYCLMVIS